MLHVKARGQLPGCRVFVNKLAYLAGATLGSESHLRNKKGELCSLDHYHWLQGKALAPREREKERERETVREGERERERE